MFGLFVVTAMIMYGGSDLIAKCDAEPACIVRETEADYSNLND